MSMTANDKAQVTVMTALAMAVLLGLVAFATDIGLFLITKRQMQTAADSAAMAGAAEINYGDVTAAARADAAQNGFTNGVNGITVAVSDPPSSGPPKGTGAGYVEVVVSQSQPTIFMKILNRGSMVVSARAVATNVPAPSCVDTLSPSPPSGFGVDLSGGADLDLTGCGLIDDSTGSSAFKATGGITLTASFVDVAGSASIHNGADIMGATWPAVSTPPVETGIAAAPDPLASVVTAPPASEYSSCSSASYGTGTYNIGPATSTGYVCYSSFTVTSGSPVINLRPGLYIFNGSGGLNIASGTTMNGTGGVLVLLCQRRLVHLLERGHAEPDRSDDQRYFGGNQRRHTVLSGSSEPTQPRIRLRAAAPGLSMEYFTFPGRI